MKRDMDVVREILFAIEALKEPDMEEVVNLACAQGHGTTSEEAIYNLGLLVDAGLVSGVEAHSMSGKNWLSLNLTWNGHELLDAIRDPEIWRRTRDGAKKVGQSGIEFVWELAKGIGKQVVKEKLGLDF